MIPDRFQYVLVQYFLEHFGIEKMWPNLDPRSPYLLPTHFKKYRNTWEHPWAYYVCKHGVMFLIYLIFVLWSYVIGLLFMELCFESPMYHVFSWVFEYLSVYQSLWWWGSENDKLWLNKISKIWDMNFISIKKHEMESW